MSSKYFINIRNLVFFSIILFPLDQLTQEMFFGEGMVLSFLRIITVIIALSFFQNIKFAPFGNSVLIFALFIVLALLSTTWAENKLRALSYTFQLIVMLLYALKSMYKIVEHKLTLEVLAFTSSCTGALVSFLAISGTFTSSQILSTKRLVFDSIGVNALAISIGFFFLLGIIYLLISIEKNRIKVIIVVLSLFMMGIFLLRTGTRSVLWGVFFSIILSGTVSLSSKITIKQFVKYLLVFAASLGMLYFIGLILIDETLLDRFKQIRVSDIASNSRLYLWMIGLDWYSQHLLGTGAGNEMIAYQNISMGREAHNIFISAIVQLGMVGIVLIILFFFSLFMKLRKITNLRLKFSAMLIYIYIILQALKGSFLQTRLLWIPLILIFSISMHDRLFSVQGKIFSKRKYQRMQAQR